MKLLYRLLFITIFLGIFAFIVAYARGYRLDFKKKSLTSTGILALSSYPKAAKIFVNGALKGVTDTNLTYPPGSYNVEIKKDGYTSLNKKINLKGELVVTIDALLFPLNPTLSPLTNMGLIKAISVNESEKIIIFIDNAENESDNKNGVYLFEGGRKPLPFFPPLKPIVLKENMNQAVDFATAKVTVSPDLKEAIFEFGEKDSKVVYLLSLEEETKTPFDVSSSYDRLITAWDEERQDNYLKILETYPDDFAKIASSSFDIIAFSPSETKLLYRTNEQVILPPMITPALIASNQTIETRSLQKDKIYVYDKKEDKNYEITSTVENNSIQWYFDSKHLLINKGKKIVVVGYDGDNNQSIYSGTYESAFFNSTLDGKLIVLANLNPDANKWPDLYLVGTR